MRTRKLILAVLACLSWGRAQAVDVQISQLVDTPDPAVRAGQITYTVNVQNSDPDIANAVVLSVPLPATTTFISVSGDPGCTHTGGTPGTVTCNFGNLTGAIGPSPADIRSIDIVIRTTAATGASIGVTGTVTTTSPQTNTSNDTLTQNTTINDGADLSVIKSGSPDPVVAAGSINYSIDVTNNGPNDASSLTVTDTLPGTLTYQSASGSGWSCGNSGQTVTCTRATLLNTVTAPTIALVAKVTGAITGTVTNSVTVAAVTGDPDTANNTTTANTTVTNGTDLSISKSISAPAIGNTTTTFTLQPRNLGPFDASTVSVTDTLPPGYSAITASGTGWSCSLLVQTVTCTRAVYAVGAANDITVQTTAPASGSFSNTASISSATADPISYNDSDTINFTLVPDGADLSITKSKGPDPVAQGAQITNTLRVSNHGPQTTTGTITITDTLSADETYVSYSGVNWACSAASSPQVVTCSYSGAALTNGANTSQLLVTTLALNPGTLTNTACAGAVGGLTDGVSSNNCVSRSVTSTAQQADLSISKSATTIGGDTVLANTEDRVTYTVTTTNNGPDTVSGVVMTDTIPGYVSGAGGTGVGVSDNSGGKFACTTGNTVTCTMLGGQNMVNGESVVFTILVDRPLIDGSLTNTATVTSTVLGDPNRNNNSATANVTVDPVADLEVVSKSVSPTTVQAGTNATYVITVHNIGPSSSQNVMLNDVFTTPPGDSGYTFLSATPSKGSCAAFNTGTETLSCNLGTLTSGETETIITVIRPNWMSGDPSRTLGNTATISSATTLDRDNSNNQKSATLNINTSGLDLLVNKTDLVDPIGYDPTTPANNIVTYRIDITNQGPSLATGLTLVDTLSPKAGKTMRFLCDKTNAGDDCAVVSGASLCNNLNTADTGPATLAVTCLLPNLAVNATTTRYLDFRVETAPDATGDTHSDSATVSSNEHDSNLSNNTESESTTYKKRVDLALTKVASQATVQMREPFSWTLTVTNNGPGDSDTTTVTDTLPSGIVFNGATPSWSNTNAAPASGTCGTAGQVLTCNLGLLESGKIATITVPVRVNTYSASISNCATATTDQVDPVSTNNVNQCGSVSVQRSRFDGIVYRDLNDNGTQQGGETGIQSVTVKLTGTDAYGNAVNSTATTNSSGAFTFNNLSPSNPSGYTLTETQPAGYFDGQDFDRMAVIGGSKFTDVIASIQLAANTTLTGFLFGELSPASITGTIWHDVNNDGVINAGEVTRISGVSVALTGTDDLGNAVNTSVSTSASGVYSFASLRPGTYTVTETQPAGWLRGLAIAGSGAATAGTPDNALASASYGNVIAGLVLTAGQTAAGYNFAELRSTSLSGNVWHDANNNAVREAGETTGISAITITLSGTDYLGNAVSMTTTTAADGTYSFTSLNPGTYTLDEGAVSGYLPGKSATGTGTTGAGSADNTPASPTFSTRISGIVLASNESGVNFNFGEVLSTSLGGAVWYDADNNGVREAGETTGISGITITLNGTDDLGAAVSATTTSAADGSYNFTALRPGTYRLDEGAVSGYLPGKSATGTGTGIAGTADNTPASPTFSTRISGIGLGSGNVGINYNFGEVLATSLAGYVWSDLNNDGVRDAGETTGIGGITLTLTGTDDLGNTVTQSTTTAADGSYSFSTLRPGTYQLDEGAVSGYLPGRSATGIGAATPGSADNTPASATFSTRISGIVLASNDSATAYNFGEILATSLSGAVWHDANNNGVRESGETTGIAGVTLTLSGTDDLGNTVNLTANTAANGAYSFTGLRPGTYQLDEGAIGSYLSGLSAAGTGAATVGTADNTIGSPTFSNRISGIVLAPGNTAADYNFGEVHATSLSGYVWSDLNNDGVRDAGETTGISGIILTLSGTDDLGNPISLNTTSAANGSYSFANLRPGTYQLDEGVVTGYKPGLAATGSGAATTGSADNTIASPHFGNRISGVVLASDNTAIEYNFGELANTSINGFVWHDANNDGVRDAGETTGIAGITITLNGTDDLGNAINQTANTAADGSYGFASLRPGNYRVDEGSVAGYAPGRAAAGSGAATTGTPNNAPASPDYGNQITGIVLAAGNVAVNNNFGEVLSNSLSGRVYNDINGNGSQDGTEPGISGVTITLTGTNDLGSSVTLPVTTDSNGDYSFTGLRPGVYTLTEIQPSNYVDSTDSLGNKGGTLGNDVFSAITLVSGDAGINYVFVERSTSLSGSVYVDSNNNGLRDSGEAGIPNVSIRLSGTNATGTAVNATTLTGSNGNYQFTALPASNTGGYTLTETQPALWADGQDHAGSAGGTAGNDVITGIVLGSTDFGTAYVFGEHGGALSGRVYNDLNNNGVREPVEPGIPGVTITLSGNDSNGTPITHTVTTVADGTYRIADLPLPDNAGYTLTETQPTGNTDGIDTLGSLGGTLGNDIFSNITLPIAGAIGTDYNYGERTTSIAEVSGKVWLDSNHDRLDNDGNGQPGWAVELIHRADPLDNSGYDLIATATTDSNGQYDFTGLTPGSGYEIRFRHPNGGYIYGKPQSTEPGVDLTYGTIRNLTLNAGITVINQDLPLDPDGVIYNALTRVPVAGAAITLSGPAGFDANLHLVGGASNLTQTTGSDGQYQYLLLPTAPAGTYRLTVTEPVGYVPGGSVMLPACTNTPMISTAPDPALVQINNTPPAAAATVHNSASCPTDSGGFVAGAASTQYFLSFALTPSSSANVVNNHIPLDPITDGAFTVVKSTPLLNVSRGDLVPYTIRVLNNFAATLPHMDLRDQIPPGFKYKSGTATLDGLPVEPQMQGRTLTWADLTFTPSQERVVKLMLVVGGGVSEGDYINQAWVENNLIGVIVSNVATAKVRVVPDPTFDCSDLIGKVFDDRNANGYQDKGELGIAGVRIATVRGLLVTTDAYGRFHVTCADIPNEDHGSNFIMKLDERSLPSGYRLTTENPRVVRLTRGKLTKLNFGASIHRVIRIDVTAVAFDSDDTALKPQWETQLDQVVHLLKQQPSVLRLGYARAADEPARLATRRIDALADRIQKRWQSQHCCYALEIETEMHAQSTSGAAP